MSRAFPVRWKRPPAEPTEAEIQHDILQYLSYRGIFAWPTHGPRNRPAVSGMPDILGARQDGRMIAIEVKDADGIVSERQEKFLRELHRRLVLVIVAHSVDDVERAL